MAPAHLLEIECRIKPEKRREFTLSVGGLLRDLTPGHSNALIYEDQGDPGHFLCVEEWRSAAALEAYLAGDDYLALLGACQVLGVVVMCRVVDLRRHQPTPKASPHRPVSLAGWSLCGDSGTSLETVEDRKRKEDE